tara:strand:+ start:354 stop:1160 length:807 start_codon:yes stop_codon:yes gene_type:complete
LPEGPECKRTAEGLARAMTNKTIANVEILSGRYMKEEPGGIEEFRASLPIKVIGAGCHGKFIFALCTDESFIWSTLGMTGYWNTEGGKYARVRLDFSDGTYVHFNDMRNFGTMKFVKGKHEMVRKLKSLGPDMLAEDVSNHKFKEALMKRPKWSLAKALMKQTLVCGVGNYVKADSLWLAKLSPHRTVESLSDLEFNDLNEAIKKVMRTSYESGGATIQSYASFDDEVGEYTQQMIVYNQTHDPEGNEVTKEKTKDGRTTHWVPLVQR